MLSHPLYKKTSQLRQFLMWQGQTFNLTFTLELSKNSYILKNKTYSCIIYIFFLILIFNCLHSGLATERRLEGWALRERRRADTRHIHQLGSKVSLNYSDIKIHFSDTQARNYFLHPSQRLLNVNKGKLGRIYWMRYDLWDNAYKVMDWI